ncbi:MAG: hypothetical protein KAI47_26590 [Deltaproteobacteria bacterium]|nr:hypothetical protein [Deltaproteobacteria bacterium]
MVRHGSWIVRGGVVALLASLVILTLGRSASAQLASEAHKRIMHLNKTAMDNYDSLEFDAAKKELLEALRLASTARITDKKLLGVTHLNLGVVYGAGFNKRAEATTEFKAALKLNRQIKLPVARATPAIEEMFKAAKDSLGPEVPEPSAFRHKVVDEATAGQSVIIRVQTRPSLGATQVLLHYRKSGTARFVDIAMRAYPKGVFRATIPAAEVRGRSIYYYIEAQDDSGGRLAGSGEAASPNIISINPAVAPLPKPGGTGDGGGEGPDGPRTDSKPTSFSISLMVGTGGGIVFGGQSEHVHVRSNSPPRTVSIKPGVAFAPVHVAVDLGYHLTRGWHLSALVRLQLLTALHGNSASEQVSVLGVVRAKRFFGDGMVRFFLHFGAGGGQIRHRIPLGDYDSDGATADDVVDSRAAGVAAFAFGGGMLVAFHRNVGLVLELGGLILVPDFAAHADLNLGVVFSF